MKTKYAGSGWSKILGSVACCVLIQHAAAREWTNDKGQTIEAEYVSSDGKSVVLKFNGKDITYSLERLSAADREFVAERLKQADEVPAPEAVQTGWIHEFPVKPAFPDTKGYLESSNAKAAYKAFDSGKFPDSWKDTNQSDAEKEFAYENGSAIVYVPGSYDGTEAYGVYVHISPGDGGEKYPVCAPVMDRLKMIYVSPKGTSNKQPMLRRVKLAVDALASVNEMFKTDPKRTCVGGYSGGGHMAMLTHAMFPAMFVASVSHAAQSYLPVDSCGHFPGLEMSDFKSKDLRGHKWCVISGNKDMNYQEILKTTKEWEQSRLDYRFFDVPDMGHTNAPAERLEEALKWIGM